MYLSVAMESQSQTRLVAVAADGFSVYEKWIIKYLIRFFQGLVHFVALVDTKHNCKNFCYQFMGNPCVLVMGRHMVNTNLFSLVGVPQEPWRVKDWSSDLVVCRWHRYKQSKKLLL